MGMGYAGSTVTTLDESVIKRKCPKLLKQFNEMKEKIGAYRLYNAIEWNEWDEDGEGKEIEHAVNAHGELVSAFRKKTGLDICFFYHDVENDGDRYDDIGEAWIVSNAYQLTEQAKPFEKQIKEAHFVQWG